MPDEEPRFDVQPNVGNHFAWLRTAMALQRTLMASVRTSVSLTGFGFTVAQFFDKMRGQLPGGVPAHGENMPRNLGLILIGAGVISLVTFVYEYHEAISRLSSGDYGVLATKDKTLHKPAYLVAFAVILIGIAAFVSILFRF